MKGLRFTLVELLVVVTIIMVLAALLMPSLQRAKQTAHTISCANNERQYSLAAFSFVNDYNGYLPCSKFSGKNSGYVDQLFPDFGAACYGSSGSLNITYVWTDTVSSNLFYPYFKAFYSKCQCPAHPSRKANPSFAPTYLFSGDSYGHLSTWYSYGMNKRTLASRPHPSQLFMMLEREDYPWINSNSFNDCLFQWSWGTYQYKTMGYHHNNFNGFNTCFFDGHVKFYKLSRSPVSETDGGMLAENWR